MHAEGRSERFQGYQGKTMKGVEKDVTRVTSRFQGKTKEGVEKDVTIVISMWQHSLTHQLVSEACQHTP